MRPFSYTYHPPPNRVKKKQKQRKQIKSELEKKEINIKFQKELEDIGKIETGPYQGMRIKNRIKGLCV